MKLKLLLALLISQIGFAQQRTCASKQFMQTMLSNPDFKQQYLDLQQQFKTELQQVMSVQQYRQTNSPANSVNSVANTIRIPVAVHFPSVTATAANASLRDCLKLLAQSQINILNADYNATNSDISLWTTASTFYPGVTIGNMDVSFELATQSHPTGSGLGFPIEGQVAVTFGTDFLSNADSDTTWAGYCNLVVRNISGGILGYSPLGGSPSSGMTVVIDNNAFGATMSGSPSSCAGYVPGAPYDLGRTLTHELGHFFNLDHTFESCDGANCATSGDNVCDTPAADTPYYNCDAPGSVTTNCGTTQLTMNYMDYVQDACMYMFTTGQANRMKAWYNTIVSQLETNVLANTDFVSTNFSIAPNPNSGSFEIQLKEVSENYSVLIFDALGREIYNSEFIQNNNLVQNIKIDNALSGLYFVTIQSNGATITKKILVE